MKKSIGFRFLVVGLLTLLMFVPLFFVSDVVQSRKYYSQSTLRSVGNEWGGEQAISGPVLVIPVEETIDQITNEQVIDPQTGLVKLDDNGNAMVKPVSRQVTVRRAPIYAFPNGFDVTIDTQTQMRHRGIFKVPVYQAALDMRFDFPVDQIADTAVDEEVILWDAAEIIVNLSANKALRGEAVLAAGGRDIPLEPIASKDRAAGIVAAVSDPRGLGDMTLKIGLNGASALQLAPVGRQTSVVMRSDWPHPSFTGAFLPDDSEITEAGFEARWTIPHLARTLPQISREDYTTALRQQMVFGVNYVEPNDFYQKAYRAAKYGILFIALTFLTVLLIEKNAARPAHPVQYILIGLAQSIFVLLMVAYAEQIGFGPAYALSAGATIILLTLFGFLGLKLGRRAAVLGVMLVVLYAVLYLILRSADFALLAGATLAFIALAATMWFTRDEDWYGPEGGGIFARKPKPAPAAAGGGKAPAKKAAASEDNWS